MVNTEWMRGPYRVRVAVIDYLKGYLPGLLPVLRRQWNVGVALLPDVPPLQFYPFEAFALDIAPKITVEDIPSVGNVLRTGFDDDGAEQYTFRYNIRLSIWARAVEYINSIQARDNLSTAVRIALLSTGTFGNPDLNWNKSSFSEQFTEPIPVKGDRWVAGAVHSFSIDSHETLVLPALGEINTITISTGPMPST